MLKEFRKDILVNKNQNIYIMNKVWLAKWKNYINYNQIKLKMRYNINKNEGEITEKNIEDQNNPFPGCINNFQILLPLSDYYNDGDRDNEENVVINPDINIKQNLKIVNEKIWNYFYNKYGGGPEIKTRYIKNPISNEEEIEIIKDKV